MAWIFLYILWVSLFQITTLAADIAGRSVREGERFANRKYNGSYKILNRLTKPFVSKRVEGSFVFPEEKFPAYYQKPIIPEDCKKIGICNNVTNYPEVLVAILLKEMEKKNITRFNKDIIEVPQIAQRIGPEDETIELCSSSEQAYAPQGAMDENDVWHVIVNDKEKPRQIFRVEFCHSQESSCSSVAYFQNGYKSRCVQKFMYRNMVALNNKSEAIEKPFKVPSCCKCVLSLN